jgi:hypothetical protein
MLPNSLLRRAHTKLAPEKGAPYCVAWSLSEVFRDKPLRGSAPISDTVEYLLVGRGFLCRHPEDSSVFLDLVYSERLPAMEADPAAKQAIENRAGSVLSRMELVHGNLHMFADPEKCFEPRAD